MKKPTTQTKYLFSEIYDGNLNDYHLCETCSKLVLNDLYEQKYIESLINYQDEFQNYFSIEQIFRILSRNIFLTTDEFGKTIKDDYDKDYRKNIINSALSTVADYCKENH